MRRWLPFLPLLLFPLGAAAQEDAPPPPATEPAPQFDPYFLGYGTEPEMDYAGRMVMSLQSGLARAFGSIGDVGERHPGVAPAWEFPLGAVLLLVQHEIGGHGGRAREFGLSPSYGFNYDLSAYTSTRRAPKTNEELILIASAGTEADGVMAHRVLLDLLTPGGADGAKVPLLMTSKLDLTFYVFGTEKPEPDGDFLQQYHDGNDIAIYLVSRQSQRHEANPADVWNGQYIVDFSDPLLRDNWDDARATAVWNLLDPALVSALYSYFRQHVVGGQTRVESAGLPLGNARLLVGTRGALGPQSVSRFLDFYVAGAPGLFTFYVRDLDSSLDRSWGYGAGIRGVRFGPVQAGFSADVWKEPISYEELYEGTFWNATAEVETRFSSRWGAAAKLGAKSKGFLPGLPKDEGVYFGLGVQASF